ncbi:MAG: NADH-quinone oxidoreductase subunit A [Phycisphaeraceae bacterium]|nr:NADH-quinone oxidoreductase subunit A [Phycisphaeraceae bacterium]
MLTLADSQFSAYAAVGLLVLMAAGFGIFNLIASTLIGPRRRGKVKEMVYESGMNPVGDARRRFNVRFYVVAMTFLLFDVEIVFLYPWAVNFASLGPPEGDQLSLMFLLRMGFFVLTSVVAFVYAWGKGVFRYD